MTMAEFILSGTDAARIERREKRQNLKGRSIRALGRDIKRTKVSKRVQRDLDAIFAQWGEA